MRLVNFNVRHGGGRRCARIAEAIAGHKPDVVVLTEYRSEPGIGELLRAVDLEQGAAPLAAPKQNSVAVFSKTHLQVVPSIPEVPAGAEGKWIEVAVPAYALSLVVVYVPGATSPSGAEGIVDFDDVDPSCRRVRHEPGPGRAARPSRGISSLGLESSLRGKGTLRATTCSRARREVVDGKAWAKLEYRVHLLGVSLEHELRDR